MRETLYSAFTERFCDCSMALGALSLALFDVGIVVEGDSVVPCSHLAI